MKNLYKVLTWVRYKVDCFILTGCPHCLFLRTIHSVDCLPKNQPFKNQEVRLLGAVMAGLLKKTTGLVGLAVCETPHERLKILYTKILDVLGHIPKNAAYRKYTEQITNEKLSIVKAEPDIKKLEEQLQGGQIEEVILQAENELSLARKMIQWKPWEPLVEEPPASQWKWPI